MPLVTYAPWSLGWIATQRGSSPTPISAILMAISLPCIFLTLMIDTLFASRLTTTTRCSSEVRAMVVEWLDVAAMEAGATFFLSRGAKAHQPHQDCDQRQYGAGRNPPLLST